MPLHPTLAHAIDALDLAYRRMSTECRRNRQAEHWDSADYDNRADDALTEAENEAPPGVSQPDPATRDSWIGVLVGNLIESDRLTLEYADAK